MSDITVFEAMVASDSEDKIAKQAAADRLAAAIYDVREQYGAHLFCARSKDEFHDRVALCKDDMIKTVNAHLMPVTGVMRKVCKAMEREWQERHADNTGPEQGLEKTFSPDGGDLVPEGDFRGWLDSVDQDAPAKVDRNFTSAEHRVDEFAGSGRPVTNPYTGDDGGEFEGNPQGRGHWKKEKESHRLAENGLGGSADVTVPGMDAAAPTPSGGPAAGMAPAPGGAAPMADPSAAMAPAPTMTASIIKRYAQWCVDNLARPSFATMEHYAARRPDREYLALASALQRHAAAPHRRVAGGSKNYLQQADEAITNLLNEKAEEFQESIQPLQQALQTIQYAEQMQAAQNPMNVQPPAGTVNVLPQNPAPQGAPPPGVDPSSGQVDPAMLAQMMAMGGGGGGQGGPPPAAAQQGAIPPELAAQMQMQARRRVAMPDLKQIRIHDKDNNLFSGVDESGERKVFKTSPQEAKQLRTIMFGDLAQNFSGVSVDDADIVRHAGYGAKSDGIAGYTYDGSNFEPGDLIEYMIAKGELLPAARDMNIEDVLRQHAEANAIDVSDERNYDSSEHPKVIFNDQLDPDYDSDWYSGFRESKRGGYPKGKAPRRGRTAKEEDLGNCQMACGKPAEGKLDLRILGPTPFCKPCAERYLRAKKRHQGSIFDDWEDWNRQRSKRGILGLGGDKDLEDFAAELGIGRRGVQMLRRHLFGSVMPRTGSTQRQAWMGWGTQVAARQHAVPGWEWDKRLSAYVATETPKSFLCKCGAKLSVPGYHNCKCGKVWNSYVIGTGGENRQAAVEKYLCREVAVRDNVIVARRRVSEMRPLNAIGTAPSRDNPVMLMYGGAFNPPHEGHVAALKNAHDLLTAAGYTVGGSIVAPTADKLLAKKSMSDGDRLNLAARAAISRIAFPKDINGVPVMVDTGPSEEVERATGKPRRSDLARWAQQRYPNHTIVNVTGEDAVVPGAPDQHPSLYAGEIGSNHEGVNYLTLPRDPEGSMSSSAIRAALAAGQPLPGMTPESEQAYREQLAKHRSTLAPQGAVTASRADDDEEDFASDAFPSDHHPDTGNTLKATPDDWHRRDRNQRWTGRK